MGVLKLVTYGILDRPNIRLVVFGDYSLEPWYGNAAYFDQANQAQLGIHSHGKRSGDTGDAKANGMDSKMSETQPQKTSKSEAADDEIWLETLYVCDFCFKYTASAASMNTHRSACPMRKQLPVAGKLVYWDESSAHIIREIRGFKEQLFCQDLCLFGKLFLDDKSVYYNVDQFDFYVLYGQEIADGESGSTLLFKPMGFFSKEVVSWDNDNNLACICVFPPFQRRHLGSLLIEFLYALARLIPGQFFSGPEFPLSPYGRVSYLNFWARKLAPILADTRRKFTLRELAVDTGFRKEDILLTLEFMKVLFVKDRKVSLHREAVFEWCKTHNVSTTQRQSILNEDCLLI